MHDKSFSSIRVIYLKYYKEIAKPKNNVNKTKKEKTKTLSQVNTVIEKIVAQDNNSKSRKKIP